MTDSFPQGDIDATALNDQIEKDEAWLAEEDQLQGVLQEEKNQAAATEQQYRDEQADPRNREGWGISGVIKELQSAFAGGIQDTASSIVTAPERIIDLATGEMGKEGQTE